MMNDMLLHSFISDFRIVFLENGGDFSVEAEEKLMTDCDATKEEADVLIKNIVSDLAPKNMVLTDKSVMSRRRVLIKTIDSKASSSLYAAIAEEYLVLRNTFKKTSVDKELCVQMLAIVRQKTEEFRDKEAKLAAMVDEFADFCEVYYLDDQLFKRLRANIKYAAIIQDADKKVEQVAAAFSDKEYLVIAEQLYREHADVFKNNCFYYGVILGILNATCQGYELAVPDYSALIPKEEERVEVEEETVVEPEVVPEAEVSVESENEPSGNEVHEQEESSLEPEVPLEPEISQQPDEPSVPEVEVLPEEQESVADSVDDSGITECQESETEKASEADGDRDADGGNVGKEDDPVESSGELEKEVEKEVPEEVVLPVKMQEKKKNGWIWILLAVVVVGVVGGILFFILPGEKPREKELPKDEVTVSLPLYYPKIKTDDEGLKSRAFDVSGEGVLTDKSIASVWRTGDAKGKELVFTFNQLTDTVYGIVIYNGAVYKDTDWREYGRVKSMTLSVDGVPYALLKLEDTKQAQLFDVEIKPNSGLTFRIEDVYAGEGSNEVAIAEMMFVGKVIKAAAKPQSQVKPVDRVEKKVVQTEEKAVATTEVKPAEQKSQKVESKPIAETPESQLAKAKELYANKNYEESFPLFKKAATKGNAEAQYYLGLHYDRGLGVKGDQFEALVWYRRAAAAGNTQASARLKELGY